MNRSRFVLVVALVMALPASLAAGPAHGTRARPAQQAVLEVADQRLPRRAQATRQVLFGLTELYTIALYAPHQVRQVEGLRDPAYPTALLVDVQYDGRMPDHLPSEWKQEITPLLSAEQQHRLRQAYAGLGSDDTVLVLYAPRTGTRVSVSGTVVLTDPGHALMLAFLEIWLGQSPISSEIKQTLVSAFMS